VAPRIISGGKPVHVLVMDWARAFIRGETVSWLVAAVDTLRILSLYQSAVYNKTKYRRLRQSCCNKLLTISKLASSS